jgi:hypothetical protein
MQCAILKTRQKYHNNARQLFNLMLLKMAIALKSTETRKTASITTTIAVAILATALTFPTMTTVALAQSSNDFQEFMECLFGDVGGSAATAQDIENVLQGNSADVTEQEIRDCFSPIYNDGTGSEDNTASSNSNDDDDDETDSTDETNSTDETDNTEGGDTTEGSDGTDTSAGDDTTTENPGNTDNTDNNTQE